MAQISTVEVPCLVLQLNNTIQIDGDQVIGKILQVPCRNDFQDDPDYWFVPIKDSGIFTTFQPVPAVGDNVNPPTFDSIKVFRVRDKFSSYTWWIYGTNANFVASCSTCCDTSPVIPMPGTIVQPVIRIAPCSTICFTNNSGSPYSLFGLPQLPAGKTFFPFGSRNNVAFPAASSSGYANITLLLAFLNTNWTPFVWTASADGLTLTATGGTLTDTLCVSVIAITPSP